LLKRLFISSILLFICLTDAEAETIAKVGGQDISRADAAYRIAIEKAYGNETMTEAVTLIGLINDAIEQEVGRINGVIITPEELTSLRKHADETSKAPEILSKVKRVFGDNLAAYDRLYLLPRIMNRKLRSWYSRNAEIHQKERTSIEKAYSLVKSGKTFEEAAKAYGLNHTANEYKTETATVPDALRPFLPKEGATPADPMIAILQALSEGEVYKNIVEDDNSYRVIRLLKKEGTAYKVEAITVLKQPFEKWFKGQGDTITIKILDKSLEQEITTKYPEISWVKAALKRTGKK